MDAITFKSTIAEPGRYESIFIFHLVPNSSPQFKDFAGTYGKMQCEFYGIEKLAGRWEDEETTELNHRL